MNVKQKVIFGIIFGLIAGFLGAYILIRNYQSFVNETQAAITKVNDRIMNVRLNH
jgi:hypothetical protein